MEVPCVQMRLGRRDECSHLVVPAATARVEGGNDGASGGKDDGVVVPVNEYVISQGKGGDHVGSNDVVALVNGDD